MDEARFTRVSCPGYFDREVDVPLRPGEQIAVDRGGEVSVIPTTLSAAVEALERAGQPVVAGQLIRGDVTAEDILGTMPRLCGHTRAALEALAAERTAPALGDVRTEALADEAEAERDTEPPSADERARGAWSAALEGISALAGAILWDARALADEGHPDATALRTLGQAIQGIGERVAREAEGPVRQ